MTRNRLRQLRLEKDLTQQELADKVGCTARAISFYETGARNIPYRTLTNLAKFFDADIEFILGESQSRKADAVPSYTANTTDILSCKEVGLKQIIKATMAEIAKENESPDGLKEIISMIKMLDGSDRETVKLMVSSMLRNEKYKKQYSNEKVG